MMTTTTFTSALKYMFLLQGSFTTNATPMDTPSPSCNKKTTSEQFFTPSLLKPGFLDLDFQQAFDEIFTWISRIEDLIQPEPQGGSGIGASAIQRRGDFFFLLLGNGRHVPPWDLQDLAISLDISWGVGLNTVEEIQHWFAMARNLKNNGITYQPQLVTWPDFWLPSTVGNSGSGESSCHFLLEISKGTWWLLGVF